MFGESNIPIDTITLFPERQRLAAPDSVMIPGTVYIGYAFSDGETQQTEYVNMPEFHPLYQSVGC